MEKNLDNLLTQDRRFKVFRIFEKGKKSFLCTVFRSKISSEYLSASVLSFPSAVSIQCG